MDHKSSLLREPFKPLQETEPLEEMMDTNYSRLELVDIDNSSGWLTGNKLTNPHLCTASESRPCHIFQDLPTWNEFLCMASMELKEECPGQLNLIWSYSLSVQQIDPYLRHCGCTLAYWLLKNHRCVSTFDMRDRTVLKMHFGLIACGLESSTIKKLRISDMLHENLCANIAPMLKSLPKLEELYWELSYKFIPGSVLESLCSLVETSPMLSTLSLPYVKLEERYGKLLLHALERGSTVKELVIHVSPFITTFEGNASFVSFLKKNRTLTRLEMTAPMDAHAGSLKCAVSCVSHSESLVNVSFRGFSVDDAVASAIEAYLTHNCTVVWFSLKECRWYNNFRLQSNERTNRIYPWLSILRNSRSLQGLRLRLDAFSPAECDAFFAELASSGSLKEIIIENLCSHVSLRAQEMLRHRMKPRLETSMQYLPRVTGSWWVESCRIKLSPCPPGNMAAVQAGSVTTKLDISFKDCMQELGDLFAPHTTNRKVVAELTVGLVFPEPPVSLHDSEFRKNLLISILFNSSIKKLTFLASRLTEEEVILMATIMKNCKHILEYDFHMTKALFDFLIEELAPDFDKNYSVLSILSYGTNVSHTRHFLHVMNIVRRNASLVNRAVAFVAGSRDKRNAEALEVVASSPAVVDKLCEELHLDKPEAVRKVREGVEGLQGLSDFMRACGVVMSVLQCYPRRDHQLQLTDIDEYSWLAIRKYLRIGDVLSGDQ